MAAPTRSVEVRSHLVEALEADLIGPFDLQPGSQEELPLAPSRWYLSGFLAPQEARDPEDVTQEDELGAGNDADEADEQAPEPAVKQKPRMQASLGLSVLLPPGPNTDTVNARVSWADYELVEAEGPGEAPVSPTSPASKQTWKRIPVQDAVLELPLDPVKLAEGVKVPDSRGVWLVGQLGEAQAHGLAKGTRALALFVVNRRAPSGAGRRDEQFMFQVRLEVTFRGGLVARPNLRDQGSDDWDERVADLQFRNHVEYAVGHGASVEVAEIDGKVETAKTSWLPQVSVRRVVTYDQSKAVTSMDELAELADGVAARQALAPLAEEYAAWIASQRNIQVEGEERKATRDELMRRADEARARIAAGVALLEQDPQVLRAFKLANQAMAMAARQRYPSRYAGGEVPRWRLFQLAFVLLNLSGLAREEHPDRSRVELIYFPTGGGKTEAYLGTIAFSLLLRRLRGARRPDAGLGVAVLLRYTLRLLTLDQLGRAATLICALEMLRKESGNELGPERFSIGLWVGRSATANTLAEVAKAITNYRNETSRNASSPFPLTDCPWCQRPLGRNSLTLWPSSKAPEEVVVTCLDPTCPFSPGKNRDGVPVLFVDEQIYRELPSFLVATVDKFALLPWRGETGMLFGRVRGREGRRFYGPSDAKLPSGTTLVPEGLLPPELVVQDELHLISGPLGTMVGLYEAAIEALCQRQLGTYALRPKIVASTATVRRAQAQIQALFDRDQMSLFPPPGVDEGNTYFARLDTGSEGRLYLGVAAQGRAMKAILLRVYVSLLGAAQRLYDKKGPPDQAADPYMTLAGYFNSLRELGGMRRLVEDEVRGRVARHGERWQHLGGNKNPRFANREIREPVELTSREKTAKIAEIKARLGQFHASNEHVDVLLASNMISVGVDIDRLGLMVVAGQPKSTSEYIQASSRVGRDAKRPGLVVTVYNLNKPRDRSHYERFEAYHRCFYRFVEATSVTPFSAPALDRGLAGVVVGLTRLSDPALTPSAGVMEIASHRKSAEEAVRQVAERAGRGFGVHTDAQSATQGLTQRGKNLLDTWTTLVQQAAQEAGASICYSPWDRGRKGKPLLSQALDDTTARSNEELKFVAPTSMRDVEASVHLWIERKGLTRGGSDGE